MTPSSVFLMTGYIFRSNPPLRLSPYKKYNLMTELYGK